jgi:hypothetical protein
MALPSRGHGDCPTKVVDRPTIRPSVYNYDLAPCHPRTMATCSKTSNLINKRRFTNTCNRFLRGRDLISRIAVKF